MARRRYPLSATLDGYLIARSDFRDFWTKSRISGAQLIELPADPDFFWFRVNAIVTYDRDASGSRFDRYCPTCRRHVWVTKPQKECIRLAESPLKTGIYRTDVEFACAHELHPLIVIGVDSAEALRAQKFRQINLEKIERPSS